VEYNKLIRDINVLNSFIEYVMFYMLVVSYIHGYQINENEHLSTVFDLLNKLLWQFFCIDVIFLTVFKASVFQSHGK